MSNIRTVYNVGEQVVVVPEQVHEAVAQMLQGKVGTIVWSVDPMWEHTVHFEGTTREYGYFGFSSEQIAPAPDAA